MKIKLVAYGIAREILGNSTLDISLGENSRIKELKNRLVADYLAFGNLVSLRFAVNEEYQTDDFQLSENDEVVIIPPVSGG